ncbi:MAG: cupin domain-containing protein [Mycobacterium leprae]
MALGARIRQTRTQKGITLQELADKSGLSKGFICQLENDKASPSLQALEKLAGSLGVSLAYLFLTPEETIHVVRRTERQEYHIGPDGTLVQLLSGPRRNLTMVVIELPVGTSSGGDNHLHDGEECHLVLEGILRYSQGDESAVLQSGDSAHWNGFIPHRIENCGQTPARILCVTSGPLADVVDCAECDEDPPGPKA